MENENKLINLVKQRIDWDTYSYLKKEDPKKASKKDDHQVHHNLL